MSSELEFGIFDTFSVEEWASPDRADMYDRHIGFARLAEACGYTSFFFIEHQNPPTPCVTSPATYLAALANATRTLRIGTMVFQLPMYNPIRLAQDTAMVDQLSRGRLDFGIGYGVVASEFEPWNLSYTERRAMGVEALEIVRLAWTQQEITYEGKYWRFSGARPDAQPFQKPHPTLWMGGHSRDSIDYAVANSFNLANNHGNEQTIAERFAYFRRSLEQKDFVGQRPRALLVREVHVAETDRQARAEAEPFMLQGLLGRFGVERAKLLRPEEASPERIAHARMYSETARSYDYWMDEGLAYVGSPESVVEQIARQRELIGYDVLLAHHSINSMPADLVAKSMRLFGETIIPALSSPRSAIDAARAAV